MSSRGVTRDCLCPEDLLPWEVWSVRLVVALVVSALLLAGVGAAGPLLVPPRPEQLVEGHTVFTTIEVARNSTSAVEFAAAVAVLVREYEIERSLSRHPGVLWFNDQYLTPPSKSMAVVDRYRHPCTGAVLAANWGDPVPRDANNTPYTGNATYVESYLVTDVHNHAWIVDRWDMWVQRIEWVERPLWSVAILGNVAAQQVPDDGECQGGVYADRACGGRPAVPAYGCVKSGPRFSTETPLDLYVKDPGDHDYPYPCGSPQRSCPPLEYNALLYFRLKDLDGAGDPKNHTEEAGDDWWNDVAGCHEGQYPSEWPCPDGWDDREGNSHPYNPDYPWPLQDHAGRDNHGGSADCTGDGEGDADCHATRMIDLYFGYAAIPSPRDFWLVDGEGSEAPYHCHEDIGWCSASDMPR